MRCDRALLAALLVALSSNSGCTNDHSEAASGAPPKPKMVPSAFHFRPGVLKGRLGAPSAASPEASASSDAAASAAPSSSASAAPPAPIDAALPADKTLPAKHVVCDNAKNLCDFSKSMFLNGFAKNEKAPATIVGVELTKSATFHFPFFEGLSLAAVVVDGNVSASPSDDKASARVLGGWEALYAPNGMIDLDGKEGARLLVILGTHHGDPVDQNLVDNYKKAATGKRAGAVRFVDFKKVDDLAWAGGASHARIGWEANGDDKPAFVVDVLKMSPNAGVAEHDHGAEWELLAILQGDGSLTMRPKELNSPMVEAVEPGSAHAIAPGVRHKFEPSGKSALLAVQVYTPPGPEQRFKKLAHP